MYTIDMTGKVVLVLGGGTGIGSAIARGFADAGADLAVSYQASKSGAESVAAFAEAQGRRCMLRQVDSRSVPALESMVDETVRIFGALDILVYNAGLTDPQPLFEISEEQWDRTLDINLKGMFFCARRAAAQMIAMRRPGSMVLLSSVHSIQAYPGHQHYESSKGGINMLTRSLANELAPRQIRVNAIAPGAIYVERHRDENMYDPAEAGRRIPIGRVGKPEEMADIAVFLASSRASYVTGQVLFADGGMTLPLRLD
jgi:NAD(P)-dependent dehydrogenase (short-subunit alcohol dehydrogenase family)